MMKHILAIPVCLWLFFFTSLSLAQSLDDDLQQQLETIANQQQVINSEQNKLASSHGDERLYFEDVLQRQNQTIRTALSNLVKQHGASNQAAFSPAILAQISYLNRAIKLTKTELARAFKQAEEAEMGSKTELTNLTKQNLDVLDGHYIALSDTLDWGMILEMPLDRQTAAFHTEITNRAQILSNMIRFFTKRQSELKKRLSTASDGDKVELTESLQTITDNTKQLVTNLENTVAIMDRYQLNTSEYKQLIFSITGAITIDVLDLSVVAGLASQWLESLRAWAMAHTPTLLMRLLLFAVILFMTRSVARLVKKAVKRSVTHSTMRFSVLMQEFFINLSGKVVFILGMMIGISQLGIELGPLLAGFGVAGIVIGLALQDTLSNFASGMMILIYRPFDVNDFVEVAGGVRGKVSHMSLVSTTIKTIDHQRLIIPNNKIWGDTINNISAEHFRRVDMIFGIGYGDDIRKAESVLTEILEAHPAVLKDEAHQYMIKVHALGESSVDFAVRPWVKNEDYWNVYWDVTRSVKLRFDEEKITIPFPQRDVHIYQHGQA